MLIGLMSMLFHWTKQWSYSRSDSRCTTWIPSFWCVSPIILHASSGVNASSSTPSSTHTPSRNHPFPLPWQNSMFCCQILKSLPESGSWKTRPLYFWSKRASDTQSFFFLASSSHSSTHEWKIHSAAGSFNIFVFTPNFSSCKLKLIL